MAIEKIGQRTICCTGAQKAVPREQYVRKMKYIPVQTNIGTISGRNAIYLDEYTHSIKDRCLILHGEITGSLASNAKDEWIPYTLKFIDVVDFLIEDLDVFGFKAGVSSFDEILSKGKRTGFLVRTYDHVFQVECGSYELELMEKKISEQKSPLDSK